MIQIGMLIFMVLVLACMGDDPEPRRMVLSGLAWTVGLIAGAVVLLLAIPLPGALG